MQVNSINYGINSCPCPKPKSVNFNGTEKIAKAGMENLSAQGIEIVDALRSQMNRIVYQNGWDIRFRTFNESQKHFSALKKIIKELAK